MRKPLRRHEDSRTPFMHCWRCSRQMAKPPHDHNGQSGPCDGFKVSNLPISLPRRGPDWQRVPFADCEPGPLRTKQFERGHLWKRRQRHTVKRRWFPAMTASRRTVGSASNFLQVPTIRAPKAKPSPFPGAEPRQGHWPGRYSNGRASAKHHGQNWEL
jgi:hypothetical protein